ncbi:unnamed protein product [Medioppia subpectinata]|uniref:Uncharacterized protein n=1 Tax=Medioppia subpectinata TaxID=1979941 RepID=A0A7R9PWA7_9ACAR|nr:unnamed protein product [Medioppia subpectinata]CAG2103577.1 unnamed protein product [Medioppia subpectinata]
MTLLEANILDTGFSQLTKCIQLIDSSLNLLATLVDDWPSRVVWLMPKTLTPHVIGWKFASAAIQWPSLAITSAAVMFICDERAIEMTANYGLKRSDGQSIVWLNRCQRTVDDSPQMTTNNRPNAIPVANPSMTDNHHHFQCRQPIDNHPNGGHNAGTEDKHFSRQLLIARRSDGQSIGIKFDDRLEANILDTEDKDISRHLFVEVNTTEELQKSGFLSRLAILFNGPMVLVIGSAAIGSPVLSNADISNVWSHGLQVLLIRPIPTHHSTTHTEDTSVYTLTGLQLVGNGGQFARLVPLILPIDLWESTAFLATCSMVN